MLRYFESRKFAVCVTDAIKAKLLHFHNVSTMYLSKTLTFGVNFIKLFYTISLYSKLLHQIGKTILNTKTNAEIFFIKTSIFLEFGQNVTKTKSATKLLTLSYIHTFSDATAAVDF